MKHTKTSKRIRRVGIVVLLCAVLMVLLTACGGGGSVADYTWTGTDVDGPIYFSRILPLNAAAREKFVAASRGYDMSAEGFDDKNLVLDPNAVTVTDANGQTHTVSLDGAKKALYLDDKNTGVRPSDDASIAKFNEFRDALTAEQVVDIVSRMRTTVDVETKNGFFDAILVGIGWFLQKLTFITGGSYVLGLFIFAIVVELLLLPFGIKQQKNSIKQAKLRPKEMAIRNKYKGRTDQATMQKMNQEIQQLYQEEGFNPMGGCLPLLIQMPIILALYNIVIDPLRYVLGRAAGLSSALTTYCTTARAAGGLGQKLGSGRGTIELLSRITENQSDLEGIKSFAYFTNGDVCFNQLNDIDLPNFSLFGLNTGNVPSIREPSWLWLIPVFTFVFYFASMKLTRKFTYQPAAAADPQMGCSNKMMDVTMPLMSVYISFIVPAAVGIYWIFKSIISTVKQFIVHKTMPLPVFTEEDYKAAEKALKGKSKPEKRPAGERVTASGQRIRSLHHIDDDDEPLPPPVPDREEPKKAKPKKAEEGKAPEAVPEEGAPAEESAEKKMGLAAPLKQDRKSNDNDEK